jgi:hypothetical protein
MTLKLTSTFCHSKREIATHSISAWDDRGKRVGACKVNVNQWSSPRTVKVFDSWGDGIDHEAIRAYFVDGKPLNEAGGAI